MNWVIHQKIDLSQNSKKSWDESTYAFTGDDNAHSWVVEVFSSGSAADLSGYSVSAYFIRADGNTVIASGSVSQNTVSVELPQSCYSVPGVVNGVLKITKIGSTVTIGAIKFSVSTSTTDTLVDPEHIVPSIDELLSILAEIDQITDAEQERVEAEQGRVQAEQEREATIAQIEQNAESGEYDGATFTPSVSAEGVISWTNDKGLSNPASVNIKGPQGPVGPTGAKGDKGDKGDTGDSGVYLGSTEPTDASVKVWINPDGESSPISDDDAVGTKPWSSKQIIDTLCPPLEVAGNPVQCYPVAGYPLGVKASWEPRQAGTGDPSPENVRPISGYDSVTVNTRGKNLWRNDIAEVTGAFHFGFLPAGTYTFSMNNVNDWWTDGASGKNFYVKWNGTPDLGLDFGSQGGTGERNSATFTIPVDSDITIATYNTGIANDVSNFQLEVGSQATPYEPYQPGTTATLTLPETIYGGTVDAVTGVGSNRVLWLELAVADMNSNEDFPGWRNVPDLIKCVGENWNNSLNNDHFISCNICSNANAIGANTVSPNNLISVQKASFGLTQSQWKEQYPDLVVQFCLKLATPEPFQATGAQAIPALPGTNTIYTDADSVTVTGRADPNHTINALNERIAALEDAATGG